ncbi:hypothetical protein B0H14DRAFT_2574904 [Mycena olivaceomarginata]|nr:hypothetical protein B0H14DRAFT_2574904 [Mycena olivaceomarginata]
MSYQCFSAAGARPLKSSFILNAPAINATAVALFLANQTADCTTGIRTFPWSSENAVPAMLQDEHMSRGKSKVVFKRSVVTPLATERLNHFGRGKYFLHKFKEECQEEEIDISDFEVTDFILAREGIIGSEERSEKPTFIPSPASGINWNISDFWMGKRTRVW